MDITSEIRTLAESFLKDESYFIVDVISKGVGGKINHLILLDGDNGVSIDDCASISRQVSYQIEERELIEDAFILEVSSPGLEHPLASERQFAKNVGRKLKITLVDGTMIQGKLEGLSKDALDIEKEITVKKKVKLEKASIPFKTIEKANVIVSFN